MSVKQSSGILAIWHDMVLEQEQALNDWYNKEHHAERVALEGFFSARRHIALEATPKFFVFYETTDPSVLETPAYLDCVNNPSSWTQRCMPTTATPTTWSAAARPIWGWVTAPPS